jgi:hypothetical protein
MNKLKVFATAGTLALLVGCGGSSSNDNNNENSTSSEPPASFSTRTFEVSIVNLSAAQPFSPVGIFLHDSSQQAFAVGTPASVPLEMMAEGGDISALIEAIDSFNEVAGEAPVGPGGSISYTLTVEDEDLSNLELTVMSMLVNTNDAFTGINGVSVADLEVGQGRSWSAIAYDAGTENNTEAAGTMPGPADGGEGFNSLRDDRVDQVTMHSGVVTLDDGLENSTLSQIHRFDNAVARVRITRSE